MQSEQSIPATIGMGNFESAVVPARIIPISELVTIPGIEQLSSDQLPYLAHTPVNLQWMSRPVYWLQRGRSAAALGSRVDAGWQEDQVRLEDNVRATLHRVVAAVAAGDSAAVLRRGWRGRRHDLWAGTRGRRPSPPRSLRSGRPCRNRSADSSPRCIPVSPCSTANRSVSHSRRTCPRSRNDPVGRTVSRNGNGTATSIPLGCCG